TVDTRHDLADLANLKGERSRRRSDGATSNLRVNSQLALRLEVDRELHGVIALGVIDERVRDEVEDGDILTSSGRVLHTLGVLKHASDQVAVGTRGTERSERLGVGVRHVGRVRGTEERQRATELSRTTGGGVASVHQRAVVNRVRLGRSQLVVLP